MSIFRSLSVVLSVALGLTACGSSEEVSNQHITGGSLFQSQDLLYRSSVLIENVNTDGDVVSNCTGVLIHSSWVLTAGHCKRNFDELYRVTAYNGSLPNRSDVRTGSFDALPAGPRVTVETMGPASALNDIMLIKLLSPFPVDAMHRTPWIPAVESFLSRQPLYAVGAGDHDAVWNVDLTLMWKEVPDPILLPTFGLVQSSDITNSGDSGSGLFRLNAANQVELVGILSGGLYGRSAWTYLPPFKSWIESTIVSQ